MAIPSSSPSSCSSTDRPRLCPGCRQSIAGDAAPIAEWDTHAKIVRDQRGVTVRLAGKPTLARMFDILFRHAPMPVGIDEIGAFMRGPSFTENDDVADAYVRIHAMKLCTAIHKTEVCIDSIYGTGYRMRRAVPRLLDVAKACPICTQPRPDAAARPVVHDTEGRMLFAKRGSTISLSRIESDVLDILYARPGVRLRGPELAERIGTTAESIKSTVYLLRRKLADLPIFIESGGRGAPDGYSVIVRPSEGVAAASAMA